MTSYYDEIRLAPSVEDPTRLVYIATAGAPNPPDELVTLRRSYDEAARIVRVLFADDQPTRKDLFHQIHMAADRGLRGPAFNIADGKANLEDIHDMITDHAHKVRDRRLRSYTWFAIAFGIVPLLVGIAILYTNAFGHAPAPANDQQFNPYFLALVAAFLIPAGAAICVWAEFALRMQGGLTFDRLLTLDPDRWKPGQRVLITIGISAIFAFLLAFDAVQVGVGNLLLNDFAKKTPLLSLAVGGITGLAFPAVRDIIYRLKPEERK